MPSEKPSFARFGGGTNFATPGTAQAVKPRPAAAEGSAPVPPARPAVSKSGEGSRGSKAAGIFDALVTLSLIALFFGLPIFFTGMTFQGIAFEKQIYFYFWLLVGIIAWVSKGVIIGEMRVRRTPLDIPILLFWLFYVLSAFFSVDRWHSFWGFFGDPSRGVISITALVLAYYFLLSHFTEKRFRLMFGGFLVSSFIVVLWSFLVLMKIPFMPSSWEQYAPMSLIGTVSTLALFLGLLVPLFMTGIFAVWKDEAGKKGGRFLVTGFLFVGLALTLFLLLSLYAFVPWIVVLGGLSFFMIYILAQIVRPAEQWTWVPMLVFVLVLGFLMIGNNRLARATLPVEVTPNTALSWQIAKESLKENFIMGVGPANYGYAFSMFRPESYNLNALYTLRFYQGTGLFFETIPTLGAVGTVLLLVLWFSFLSVGLYLLTHEKQRNKVYSLGLWTVSMMLFIAGFIAAINGALLLIGVLLAALSLAVLLWESGSEERYLQLSFKAAPKFALALAFIFMVVSAGVAFLFVFMGKVFVADISAGKAVRMSAQAPSQDSANLFVQAIRRYPQEGRYYTRLGQEYMALGNMEARKPEADRDVNAVAFYVREAVAAGEKGRQQMPNDVMAVESLGLLYENSALYASDALPKAEEFYNRAWELEPHNPLYPLKLGQIKKRGGDGNPDGSAERTTLYSEARDFFQQSLDKKRDLAVAHYNMAVVLAGEKNFEGAIDAAGKAVGIDKNNLNYKYNLGVLYQLRNGDDDVSRAESLFKEILNTNEKLIDVRLSLGLLYEKEGNDTAAIEEYQKVIDLLPADAEGNVRETRTQVQQLITNVRNGTGNLRGASAPQEAPEVAPTLPEAPAPTPAPQAPVNPNQSPLSSPAGNPGTGQ